ncbi:uncharacterized protein LOC121389674 [Gigantopelta aegis]|uniref:uncharacterized protein LOC121389674 n=1 Tax=Gigantopelta aegis TaxID=1735272 RepID=UPI001B88BF99|nr:uncharacterized protein LOC121389674 [Gigantopelta aegis]
MIIKYGEKKPYECFRRFRKIPRTILADTSEEGELKKETTNTEEIIFTVLEKLLRAKNTQTRDLQSSGSRAHMLRPIIKVGNFGEFRQHASTLTAEPELTELDTAICETPINRPPAPRSSLALPDLSPILQATTVEAQARKGAVAKRKATTPPSGNRDRPSRPQQQPPKPTDDTAETWSLQAGRLQQRYHQLIKTKVEDVRQLISPPKHHAYHPLPASRDEGDYAFQRLRVQEGHFAVCVTIRRSGVYNQALLLPEMDNPTIHRILKTILGTEYRSITRVLAASEYRQYLPRLDTKDFIGTP